MDAVYFRDGFHNYKNFRRRCPLVSFFPSPSSGWCFLGQVVGLGQAARVQRGPSEAARCASNGTALLPAHPLTAHTPMFFAAVFSASTTLSERRQ